MPAMVTRYTVAFLGFSDFERGALSSYFRLAQRRTPRYDQLQSLDDADFVVADADHAASVQLVQATDRLSATVFVGSRPPNGCMAWVNRPIDGLQVMRELDALVAQAARPSAMTTLLPLAAVSMPPLQFDEEPRQGMEAEAAPGSGGAAAASEAERHDDDDDDAQATAPDIFMPDPSAVLLEPTYAPHARYAPQAHTSYTAHTSQAPQAAHAAHAAPTPRAQQQQPEQDAPQGLIADVSAPTPPPPALPMPPAPDQPRALLVDDSDIALRFLALRLQRWGLHTDLAGNSTQAQDLLAQHSYDLVFFDVDLGQASELGGLDLCRIVKQSPAAMQTSVVLVSAHHSELDRVRGTLAGCDAYLGKPLQDGELQRLLQRHGLQLGPTVA